MPLSVSVPPGFFGSINTGNSQFDSDLHNGLAMASSLLANAALSAVPQISAYNTLVGVLNTAALISSGQVVVAIARGAPLAVAQTLGFGLGSTLHGGAGFTGYTVSGLRSAAAVSSRALHSPARSAASWSWIGLGSADISADDNLGPSAGAAHRLRAECRR